MYIDNLRVLLTVLVILHHTVITYGGPGGWYFYDKSANTGALIAMTLFVATNQAFFMGFFFFLSALFTEPSYYKKGTGKFLSDRLKRLGIPLIFYSFILSPCMNYIVYRYGRGNNVTFMQYLGGYDDWINFGVLWFVAALLVFTLIYVAVQQPNTGKPHRQFRLPGNNSILLFALALGVISFVVRIFFPVGWTFKPLGFQLAHFPQYIASFSLGIIATRSNWLERITAGRGKRWVVLSILLVIVVFPSLYVVKEATNSPLDAFQGKGTWQSVISAVWEQLTGISIIMALLCTAKFKWNYTTPLLQKMARAAYATYIIHPLIVITITVLLKSWAVEPALKFLVAAPVAVTGAFLLGRLLTKVPVVKNIV